MTIPGGHAPARRDKLPRLARRTTDVTVHRPAKDREIGVRFGGFRRFDVQANYAMGVALASVVPCAVAVWLVLRNMNWDLRQIVYGAEGRFVPAFIGAIVISLIPATLGFVLGWSSANQRRNDKPARSWIGFFVGGLVVTCDLVLLIAFYMLRLKSAG